MDLILLKRIGILSILGGIVLGLITLIPYLGIISFLVCTLISGAAIFYYLTKTSNRKAEGIGYIPKDWAIYGGISGFIVFIGFSFGFIPLAAIIGGVTKASYYLGIFVMFKMGFFITLLMIFLVALMSALMNCFTALSIGYFLKLYEEQIVQKGE